MLPDIDVARARRWVEDRNDRLPERARGQIHYELDVADRFVTCSSVDRHGGPTSDRTGLGSRSSLTTRQLDDEYVRDYVLNGRAPAENRPSGNRARDCAVINWYCDRAGQEGLHIRSVRAIFEEGDPIFEASAIRALSHTQIAVRDPGVILEIEELRW